MNRSIRERKISLKHRRRCDICGKPVYSPNSDHCWQCHEFCRSMNSRGIHQDAVKEILEHVRRHGYVCYYTGRKLNMTDPKDPLYYVFDHMIPGDNRKIVLTFALLNEMKSDMTPEEFRYYVLQFAKFFTKGAPIRKRKLTHWFRLQAQ